MDKLERELAKSSLDAPKADVIAERVKKAREAMEKGELKDLPPGLREFLARDSAQAAKITGLSEEELKRMAEDAGSLEETLRKNPEILKKLAASEDAFEKILERQLEVEKRLEDALKSTQEATKQAEEKVDQSIEIAHELKSRSS
jgi:hypothetical protein